MLEWIRAIVRPVITLTGWVVVLTLILQGRDVPEAFWAVVSGLTAWWFSTRHSEGNGPRPQSA